MLVKLTTKTHSAADGYFSQLHRYGPPFLVSDELDRVAS